MRVTVNVCAVHAHGVSTRGPREADDFASNALRKLSFRDGTDPLTVDCGAHAHLVPVEYHGGEVCAGPLFWPWDAEHGGCAIVALVDGHCEPGVVGEEPSVIEIRRREFCFLVEPGNRRFFGSVDFDTTVKRSGPLEVELGASAALVFIRFVKNKFQVGHRLQSNGNRHGELGGV